ncbi:unnamed protein product [Brassica oleracea var. botrytis]|uniref:Uncharacterized protein n=1 Tax=Brassica oleracea var. oleracea TaxID=109376 RepID=A0A0D3BMQ0_BRAOL
MLICTGLLNMKRISNEQEITSLIKACKQQIDILINSIRNEEANSRGWLGLAADSLNADTTDIQA